MNDEVEGPSVPALLVTTGPLAADALLEHRRHMIIAGAETLAILERREG